MKLKFPQLNETQHYRWLVLVRCLLAVFAGFVIANLTVPVVGLAFPKSLAMATYTGLLLSFIVWLVYIIYVFSVRYVRHVFYVTAAILSVQGLIVVGFKFLGAA